MSRVPSVDTLLEWAEGIFGLYKIIVKIWGRTPPRFQNAILRRVNPSVILGAIAVIIDPYSERTDHRVLLGWHPYRSRQGTPWALLAGALKRRDQEVADPGQAVVREVREEIGLDVEIVKLLAIDTDWRHRTMDFYYECALRRGYPDLAAPLTNPEVTKLNWFRISELPDNTYLPHKRFLTEVLPGIPRLPGVSWTANQQRPKWWNRLFRAEEIRQQLLNSTGDPKLLLSSLVDEARCILNCEVVGLFVTEPPVQIVSPDCNLPADIEGSLRLLTESSKYRGTLLSPDHVVLPLSQPGKEKLGLTVWLVRARPIGRTIRLHEDWLHRHPHVKTWTGHPHLGDGTCHSMAAVTVVGQNRVLGLLKAENKMRDDFIGSESFVPFGPDDGYILEEFAVAAVSLLGLMVSG
jgi:8-oxo-dGTP pyrophosphatase MutT (NUDIX family)